MEPATHVGELVFGGITLGLCQEPGDDVTVHLPDDLEGGLTPAQASVIGAALTHAAEVIGFQ